MSSSVILAAAVFEISCGKKQTDKRRGKLYPRDYRLRG